MRIKRVEAASLGEAMRELRRELGDRALVLHTKSRPAGGLTGWFRTPRIELLGVVDEPEIVAAPPAEPAAAARVAEAETPSRAAADPVRRAGFLPAGRLATTRPVAISSVENIRLATSDWTRAGSRARRIAFVGPTGAGKTTTLAKLAARAQLDQGRRVGFVTIDTYRIGAVSQLRAYARILGVPLEVAETPEDLTHALARLADRDVVFIDSIGRSPLGGGVDTLVPFVAAAAADEVHLVLAATTRAKDSLQAARSFSPLAPNRLVITKLDETDDREALTVVARAIELPLAWCGMGQEVPDDIEEATAERVGGLLAVGELT